MNYTEEVKQEIYKLVKSESKDKKLSFLTAITCSLAQIKAFEKGDAFLTYEIKEEQTVRKPGRPPKAKEE